MFTIQQEEGNFHRIMGSSIGRVTDAVGAATRLIAFLTVISALTSCLATGNGAGTSELHGTSWELASLSGSELLSGTTITLDFREEELAGSAGCNHYSAGYQISGNRLSIGDIAATEMACPEPPGILEQEDAYLSALRAVDSYQIASGRLEILDEAGKQVLVFVPASAGSVSQPNVPPDESVVIHNVTATPISESTATAPAATATPISEGTATAAAATATPVVATETADPPPGFQLYEDEMVGVALLLPESWTVTHVFPGQSAVLQSYPEDKYVGGEARDPADTKCDLTIRPSNIDLAGHMEQVRSTSTITIVSEEEILLASGSPGIRLELESLGPSRSLVTVVNERVVVLTCWGQLAPFDGLASSIR